MMIKTMRFSKDRWDSSDELTLLPIDARNRCASVFPNPLFALGDDDDEFDDYEDDFDDDDDDEEEDEFDDYDDEFDDEEEDELDDEDDL
ncbi:MAG: hypothetical protein LBF87_04280 [Treponema sp.]|jgi:hypothetical protein|nr:hypothetical protein [Treponema sp.]